MPKNKRNAAADKPTGSLLMVSAYRQNQPDRNERLECLCWTFMFVVRAASACNFIPNAPITLRMVSNCGLLPPDNALYRLSREKPSSRSTCDIPLAFAMSPNAFAIKAVSPFSSSPHVFRYKHKDLTPTALLFQSFLIEELRIVHIHHFDVVFKPIT